MFFDIPGHVSSVGVPRAYKTSNNEDDVWRKDDNIVSKTSVSLKLKLLRVMCDNHRLDIVVTIDIL